MTIKVKFFVVSHTVTIRSKDGETETIAYRLFDYEHGMHDAQKFCAEIKAFGDAVNICVRDVDLDL